MPGSFSLRMRVGKPVVVASLAVLILVVHLALPFAWIEVRDGRSAVVESGMLSRSEMADRLAGDEAPGVPGGGLGYLLASAILGAAAGIAFLVASAMRQKAQTWTRFGSGALLGLAAALGLHGNGLWAGRATGTVLHDTFYAPALPEEHATLQALAAGDTFTRIIPISPLVVAALGLLLLFVLVRTWTPFVREERTMRQAAARHGRLAMLGAAVLLMATMMPWVVQELHEDVTPPEGSTAGTDHFFWSAYDVMQKREASQLIAEDSGEGGLIMWGGLDAALGFLMLGAVLGIVGPVLALGGKDLESAGEAVFGRLLENASLLAILSHTFAIVAAVLGAFFLHHPLEFQEAIMTGIPLILVIPAGIALVTAGLVARDVVAVDTDLVADDYPEPVVYD